MKKYEFYIDFSSMKSHTVSRYRNDSWFALEKQQSLSSTNASPGDKMLLRGKDSCGVEWTTTGQRLAPAGECTRSSSLQLDSHLASAF